jgi:hypothetical protein
MGYESFDCNRVSSILRCGSRGVLAEVDVPDECDTDRATCRGRQDLLETAVI